MKTIITTAFAFLICSVAFAQLKKADRLFDKWEYAEAAKLYKKEAEKKPSADVYYKLGQCYQKMFLFSDAVVDYDKVNAYGPYNHSDFYLNYGLVLKANARYTNARDAFMKYDNMASNDPRGRFYASSCDTVLNDLQKPIAVKVTDIQSINSADATFNPAIYKDGMVYTSNSAASTGTKKFAWTGKSYLDLYYVKRGSSDTTFSGSGSFNKSVNSEFHDGPASFTKNYDTIYFNRVGRTLKGEKKRTLGVERSKIYYATMKDDKWSEAKPFIFNNDSFGVFTPFISNDGSHLYFASDMPGGMGGTDIYYCTKQGNNWSKPINAGSTVNTFGREEFPSLDSTGNLYFASDGYKGYGGLDICVAKSENGSFQPAQVLKAPLNSPDNDYGITFLRNEKSGYISSSRKEGKGDADIYYFNLDKDSIPCDINTTIYVIGYDCIPKKKEVLVEVHRDSVYTAEVRPSGMMLHPIYFDFDKSDIRSDAVNSIDSVASILKAHPDWVVMVSGNADSRGTNEYNLALSQRRANSALRYLSSKGIDRNRIQTKAYGESQLKNNCADGVPCSEAEQQVNRRVDFTVTFQKKELSTE